MKVDTLQCEAQEMLDQRNESLLPVSCSHFTLLPLENVCIHFLFLLCINQQGKLALGGKRRLGIQNREKGEGKLLPYLSQNHSTIFPQKLCQFTYAEEKVAIESRDQFSLKGTQCKKKKKMILLIQRFDSSFYCLHHVYNP